VHYFIRLFRRFGSESGLNIQFLDKSIMVGEVLSHTPTFISWPQHFTQIAQFTLPYKLKISHFHLFTPFHPTLSRKHSQKNNTCITEPFFGGKFSDFVFLSPESTSVTGNYWLRSSGFAFGSKKSFFNVWLNRLPLLDWKLFTPLPSYSKHIRKLFTPSPKRSLNYIPLPSYVKIYTLISQ